jgi:drug/metabolite transporter (DMT)-like permease
VYPGQKTGPGYVSTLVSRRQLVMLLALAAIWGSSFMFIKVAVEEMAPGVVVFGRVFIGSVTLLPVIPIMLGWRRMALELRLHLWPLLVLGVFNAALPFWLLAWSEKRLDSGLSAVLQASTPLFTALLALGFSRKDRVTGAALAGVLIGFVGVALLVGAQHKGDVVSALAVLGTAVCYAAAALYAGARLRGTPAVVTSFGTLVTATALSLPLGVAQLPSHTPSAKAIGSVVALGALGLGVAYLLYFALIAGAGASSAVLVTYLVPALALAYGSSFLDEPLTTVAIAGLVLILAGVALGTGSMRIPRRAPVGETP